MSSTDQLISIVRQLKTAIQEAQSQTPDVIVTSAKIELKTTLTGGPGIDLSFHALELSGTYTHSEVQTLTISLTPHPPAIELMSPVSDQLIDAIAAISSAAREAAVSEPRFDLQDATIILNIGVDKQGKAMIVVGGSVDSSNYHTLTLSVKSGQSGPVRSQGVRSSGMSVMVLHQPLPLSVFILILGSEAQVLIRYGVSSWGRALVLAYLRKEETFAELAAGSSKLHWPARAQTAGHGSLVIDGTLIPVDRVAAGRPFYSGYHRTHEISLSGVNIAVGATGTAPDPALCDDSGRG